jgi:hypothetical protein
MAKLYQVVIATNSMVFMRNGNLIDLGRRSLPRLVKIKKKLAANFDNL